MKPGNQAPIEQNLNEAREMLKCIPIDEEKLLQISQNLADTIKENVTLKDIVEKIDLSQIKDVDDVNLESIYKVLEDENLMPVIENLLVMLNKDPSIVDNIEKTILPLLFSK
jgi:hypothetical protein